MKYMPISTKSAKFGAFGCLLGSALLVLSARSSDVYLVGLPIIIFMALMLLLLTFKKTKTASLIVFNIVIALSAVSLLAMIVLL